MRLLTFEAQPDEAPDEHNPPEVQPDAVQPAEAQPDEYAYYDAFFFEARYEGLPLDIFNCFVEEMEFLQASRLPHDTVEDLVTMAADHTFDMYPDHSYWMNQEMPAGFCNLLDDYMSQPTARARRPASHDPT